MKQMQLQKIKSRQYAFLPFGVLIVEPNPGLLAARTQLVSAADYYVASASEEVCTAELQKCDIRVAILSESLGDASVRKLAEEIRLHYPRAQILVFGRPSPSLADYLYDESIEPHCRPEQLLDTLFRLTRRFTNRLISTHTRIEPQALSISELRRPSLHGVPPESDPSKDVPPSSGSRPTGWDAPSGETSPHFV